MFDDQFGEDPMMVGMQPMGAAPEPKPTESSDSSVDSMMADVLAAEPTSATMDSEMSSFGEEVPSFEEPVAPAVESPEPAPAPVPEPVSEPVAPVPEPVAPAPAPEPIPTSAPTQSITPVQNTAAGAEQPKKKSSAVLIVILVVLAVVVIVATGLIAYNMGKNDGMKTNNSDSSNRAKNNGNIDDEKEGEKNVETEARKKRNAQRNEDISRFLVAVTDYQANHNGKTPFQNREEGSFTKRYIDDKCVVDSVNPRMLAPETCDAMFTDPDGTQYEWKVDDNVLEDTDTRTVAGDKVDHKIYVYQAARCGAGEEGIVKYSASERSAALLYIEEGGVVVCRDNH